MIYNQYDFFRIYEISVVQIGSFFHLSGPSSHVDELVQWCYQRIMLITH